MTTLGEVNPGRAAEWPSSRRLRRWIIAGVTGTLLFIVGSSLLFAHAPFAARVSYGSAQLALMALLAFMAGRAALRTEGRTRAGWAALSAVVLVLPVPVFVLLFLVGFTSVGLDWVLIAVISLAILNVGLFASFLLLAPPETHAGALVRILLDAIIVSGSIVFVLWGLIFTRMGALAGASDTVVAFAIVQSLASVAYVSVVMLITTQHVGPLPSWYRVLIAALVVQALVNVGTISLELQEVLLGAWLDDSSSLVVLVLLTSAAYMARPWVQRPASFEAPPAAQWTPYIPFAVALFAAPFIYWIQGGFPREQFVIALVVVGVTFARTLLATIENARLDAQLRSNIRFKTQLLRFISHEIASPLTSLRIQHDLRRLTGSGDAAPNHVVQRAMERLESLSADVRTMALADGGQLLLERKPADLNTHAGLAIASAAKLADGNGLVLKFHPCPEPVYAMVDHQRYGQVLDNLISNAIKYTPKGGQIDVHVEAIAGEARVRVVDTGLGLTPDQGARLFQSFSRVQDTSVDGLGLGLYLCRGVVDAHEGRLWAESAGAGEGSTFGVSLPLCTEPAATDAGNEELDAGPLARAEAMLQGEANPGWMSPGR